MGGRFSKVTLFFVPYLVILTYGVIYFLYMDHGDFVLLLNNFHGPVLNFFFKYWTYTGGATFFVVSTVLLLFLKRRYGLILGLIGIAQGLLTLLFKQVIFPHVPRPKSFFAEKKVLNLIEGVKVNDFSSFPSGHTMTVFALATFVALMLQKKKWSLILLIGATATAVSRVYLGHHFLIDIMAGSLVGVVVAMSLFLAFEKYLVNEKFDSVDHPDKVLSEMDINPD